MFSTVFLVPGGMSRMTQLAQRRKGTSCQPPTASSPWQTPQRRLRAPSQVFKSPNADGNDSHWALGPCSRDRMRSTVKTTTMPLMLQGLDVQGMSTLDARQLLQLASYYLRKGLGAEEEIIPLFRETERNKSCFVFLRQGKLFREMKIV